MNDYQDELSEIVMGEAIEMWVSYFKGLGYTASLYGNPAFHSRGHFLFKKHLAYTIQKYPLVSMGGALNQSIIKSCFFMDAKTLWMGFIKFKPSGLPDYDNSFYIGTDSFLENVVKENKYVYCNFRYENWSGSNKCFTWGLNPTMDLTSFVLQSSVENSNPFMNWNENPFEVK